MIPSSPAAEEAPTATRCRAGASAIGASGWHGRCPPTSATQAPGPSPLGPRQACRTTRSVGSSPGPGAPSSAARSRATRKPRNGCRSQRHSPSSRATTSRRWPTRPRRSCSRSSLPAPRLLADDPDLDPDRRASSASSSSPTARRSVPTRAVAAVTSSPRRTSARCGAGRRGGAPGRLRPDRLGQRRGRGGRDHIRLPGLPGDLRVPIASALIVAVMLSTCAGSVRAGPCSRSRPTSSSCRCWP